MQGRIITVTLNPALDKTVFIPGFRAGREFRAGGPIITAGGKGVNVSRSLARLGVRTVATGLLGGRAGDDIAQILEAEGIENDFFRIKGETRTNLTVIDPKGGRVTRVLERGPTVSARELLGFERLFSSLLPGSNFAVFSGSLPAGVPDVFYRDLIRMAKARGVRTVLDTSGSALVHGLEERPFMIKPNREEASAALGVRAGSLAQAASAVGKFHERGIEVVCLSMGRKGAFVSRAGERYLAVPPEVKRVDPSTLRFGKLTTPRTHSTSSGFVLSEVEGRTVPSNAEGLGVGPEQCRRAGRVGCGDSFLAGFLSAWWGQDGLREAARNAAAAGAANALADRPGDITREAVQSMAKRVRVKSITNRRSAAAC